MSIVGNVYLERGEPVIVLAQWRHSKGIQMPHVTTKPTAPRNVLVMREDHSEDVRPFRGLRKLTST